MLEDGIRAVGESQYNADGERFVLNTVSNEPFISGTQTGLLHTEK
jgi:hypothetical protein